MIRVGLAIAGAAILGALAACIGVPPRPQEAPVEPRTAAPAHSTARWVAAAWSDLPGFAADRATELWPALLAGCARPAAGWAQTCARALLDPPAPTDDAVRQWLMAQLQPYQVRADEGQAEGLATGYFEPELEATRSPQGRFQVPLYAPPLQLLAAAAPRKPWYTRAQIETLPAARAALAGREIAWVEDPLDALLLQVQGSGRLRMRQPDGRSTLLRVGFAGHNEQPYRSLGRWLVEQGELGAAQASWPAIKAWAQGHPDRLQELLWANPRVVFFRVEPLADPASGPRGAQGVPLTPGRSVAVDPLAVPLGAMLWLDTTEPNSAAPLRRLVMAQDTGSAITGAVRADLFFGWQPPAQVLAGRMKQPLRWWALWPRDLPPPAPMAAAMR